MPIVWCGQQLIFEGNPADIVRVIEHVAAVQYPETDLGILPHKQISRFSPDQAKAWQGKVMPNAAEREFFPGQDEEQSFFDFQLSTSYPNFSPDLTRRICFNDKCHKIIGAKPLENDSKHCCACTHCNAAIYCTSVCRRQHWENGHIEQCKQTAQDMSNNKPNIMVQHLALTGGDKKTTASLQRTIRLCVNSHMLAPSAISTPALAEEDAKTAYQVLSQASPDVVDHILSHVGMGAASIKGREASTSITWLSRGGPAFDQSNISALAAQYGCHVTYLHASCNSVNNNNFKGKLCMSPQGDIVHSSKGLLTDQDMKDGSEFMWVAANASG